MKIQNIADLNEKSIKNNINLRKSNFELLRIIAMVMIVLHHITVHCVKIQLEDQSLYKLGVYFNKLIFFKKLLMPQFLASAGKIGNIIFVLITGYFLINRKVNISKQIKKILLQFLFITPILVLGSFMYYKLYSNTFIGIQNFSMLNTNYWFIGFYIGIVSIAYLFLNNFLNRLEKNEYIAILAIMFAVCSVAFLRNSISNISNNLSTLFVGIFIYSLGGFINLYNPFKNIRGIIFWLIIFISVAAISINFYNSTLIKINTAQLKNIQGIYQKIGEFSEYNIFCILIGTSLFEIFKRMKIKDNKVINYISSATFMIYLAHDNNFIYNIMKKTNWIEICYNNFNKFILLHIMWLLLMFAIGIIIYTLYYFVSKIANTKFYRKIVFNNKS